MPTVKILIDGVGGWEKGEIVQDAPPGLVHMAKVGTCNAASGELVAELLDDETDSEEFKALQSKAKELKISKYTKMSFDELKEAISEALKSTAENGEAIGESLKSVADDVGGGGAGGQ